MHEPTKFLDPIVICPYNKSHFIARSRLQRHLVKCEKNYPEDYKLMCPYNATHRFFKSEMAEHIISCPTKLSAYKHQEPVKHGATNFTAYSEISSVIDSHENWDLDINNISRANTDDDCFSDINTYVYTKNTDVSPPNTNENNKDLRAPHGFSEAMLTEVNEDSFVEDMESVVSSMGIGRGKARTVINQLKLIGLGRGRPVNKN